MQSQSRPAGESRSRSIRSFSKRSGRLTPGQRRALDELLPQFGIDLSRVRVSRDVTGIFGRSGPVILEIGFGNGEALLETSEEDA